LIMVNVNYLISEKTIKKIENVEVTCRKAIVFIFTKT
jgi:hypothetical protein